MEGLLEEAEEHPSNEEIMELSQTLYAVGQQRTPPRVLENPEDYVITSDTTLLRMQRYADQNSSSSNDPDYLEDMSDVYFTGSEDTSGGEKLDCDLSEEDGCDVD